MKKRQWRMIVCLGTLLALGCLYAAWEMHPSGTATLPGTGERQRTILRVWDVDGPTGSSAWLRAQCGKFEKIMPGLTVYLRSVPSSECFAPETVLPDVICFADGTFSTPRAGACTASLRGIGDGNLFTKRAMAGRTVCPAPGGGALGAGGRGRLFACTGANTGAYHPAGTRRCHAPAR